LASFNGPIRDASEIDLPDDIPPALDAVLTELERELLAAVLDSDQDGFDIARLLLEDALSD
jgi:hypothetical protein